MENKAALVREIMENSLYTAEEAATFNSTPPGDAILVEGITRKFGFHPKRLLANEEAIVACVMDMQDNFFADKGGGWSFLQMCMDKHGDQWAEHPTMEELIVLAMGLGLAKWCLPKEMWAALPGNMPYVMFDLRKKAEQKSA